MIVGNHYPPIVGVILLAIIGVPRLARAMDFCQRTAFDPEVPAGLEGTYEIVGKDARTGRAYAGRLGLRVTKTGYVVARSVNGRTTRGKAWTEVCGADRIPALVFHYGSRPALDGRCRLGNDGDNYYRATCQVHQGGGRGGLEAWFQVP